MSDSAICRLVDGQWRVVRLVETDGRAHTRAKLFNGLADAAERLMAEFQQSKSDADRTKSLDTAKGTIETVFHAYNEALYAEVVDAPPQDRPPDARLASADLQSLLGVRWIRRSSRRSSNSFPACRV